MFSFVFHIKKRSPNSKIIINGHEINCSRENASIISPKINRFYNEQDSNETNHSDFFSITIPELENSLMISEQDYTYFQSIFNLDPIKITLTNKDFLKIFACELEIKELSSIIKMFEEAYDIIVNDSFLQLQKEVMHKILDISEDAFDSLINYLCSIKENNKEVNNEFIYNIILTGCLIRSEKIELLIKLLNEFEKKTNGNQFQYFKKMILEELKDNLSSNEMFFIVRYLYSINEISEDTIKSTYYHYNKCDDLGEFSSLLFDEENENAIDCLKDESIRSASFFKLFGKFFHQGKHNYTKEELDEYARLGSNPDKIFQAIKNDDLDSFSKLINEKPNEGEKYNDEIYSLFYERNSCFFRETYQYTDFCAFFGAEKIFDFILMNSGDSVDIDEATMSFAISGGNTSIIHKCEDFVKISDFLLTECLLKSIQYNRNEVFEWLIETFNPFETYEQYCSIPSAILEYSIRYNNFEALEYLFSVGIDYEKLFVFSMLYNNFYLARIALKLPYNCGASSKLTKDKKYSPFDYIHKKIIYFI